MAELYLRRWRVELYYRDIKCSLSLDVLRCNTPDMVEKEIWMQAIAYNMVRAVMLEAAITHDVDLERLSFKGTVDTLLAWTPLPPVGKPRKTKQFIDAMLLVIASDPCPLSCGYRLSHSCYLTPLDRRQMARTTVESAAAA